MSSVRTYSKWLSTAAVVALAACAPTDQAEQAPAVDLAAEALRPMTWTLLPP
jgi:hypothetical protein